MSTATTFHCMMTHCGCELTVDDNRQLSSGSQSLVLSPSDTSSDEEVLLLDSDMRSEEDDS